MSFLRSLAGTLLAWGPPGIFLLALVDSAGVPIPEGTDVLLLFVAAASPATAYLCAALATVGAVIGQMILFHLGRKGGEAYLERRTKTGRGRKFRLWFHRYGLLTVFIPTLVPAPMPLKIFVVCAGALGINPFHLFLVTVGARTPRFFAEAYLAVQVGEHSAAWLHAHAWRLAGVAAGLFAFLFLLVRFRDRLRLRRRRASS
jgi:membrane protein DedA with SNARE-associated domain